MKLETLLAPDSPWLHVFIGSESDAEDLWRSWEVTPPRPAVRQVRGHKSRTTAALLDEFAAAWQFPSYFGENWDALEECLADLSWMPATAHILGIRHGAELLEKESPAQRRTFWSILGRVAQERSKAAPARKGSPEKVFRIILQCLPGQDQALRRTIADCGVPLETGRASFGTS